MFVCLQTKEISVRLHDRNHLPNVARPQFRNGVKSLLGAVIRSDHNLLVVFNDTRPKRISKWKTRRDLAILRSKIVICLEKLYGKKIYQRTRLKQERQRKMEPEDGEIEAGETEEDVTRGWGG
uniref:Uncharacterized protein n=1 Tax=Timema poppense TaxID=170557 RepID=A0A7R9H4G9_TIMPO|nr:unnamed protein product [Timema poppensis]